MRKKLISQNKSESGQLMIEAILIMTLLFGVTVLIKRELSDRNIVAGMISGPWKNVQQMMSQGDWSKAKSEDEAHPQALVISREGDSQ